MIKLIDKGPDQSRIEFRPRERFAVPTTHRELIYGHFCHWCKNVVDALFLTNEPLDIIRYEETRVISQGEKNSGELLKIVPNLAEPASSYKVAFYRTKNGSAQHIQLKNHIFKWDGLNSTESKQEHEHYFEVGQRCCRYAGIEMLDPTKIVSEAAAITGYRFNSYTTVPVSDVPLEFLRNWKNDESWQVIDFRILDPIGRGEPLLLLNRDLVKPDTQASYGFGNLFTQWNKKVAEQTAAATASNTEGEEGDLL